MVLCSKTVVTRLLLFTTLVFSAACAQQKNAGEITGPFAGYKFLQPVGYVNDFEHLFSKKEADTLNSIIVGYEKETANQIAIVTLYDSVITDANFKDYVTALHNNWGVGTKEKNNGVLICIVPVLRKVRISNGYGIENKLSETETGKIIDDVIVPAFRKGNYYLGTKNALIAIIEKIK